MEKDDKNKGISPEDCREIYKIVAEDMAAQIKNEMEYAAKTMGIERTDFSAKLDEEGNLHTTFRASWDIYLPPSDVK